MANNTNNPQNNEKLSIIIIGCGRVAEKHLKAISKLKDLELKAVVDVNPDSAKRLLGSVKGFADTKFYNDYKEAIDEVKPSIVSVTVPSGLHFQIAKYAMEHGANLLLEKPMTMSVSEAREIYELSQKTGLKIAMGHIYRYLPIVGLVRQDIAEGKFGKVTHGTIYVRWGHGEDYYNSAAWRGTWKSDGGALMNQSIHAIDLLVWLMGSEPEEATSMIAQRLRKIEAEDLGMAVLRLENGALAQIEGTTATITSKHTAEFSVFCENGQLSMGLDSGKPHLNIYTVKENGKIKKLNGYYIRKQFKEGGMFSYKCALNPHLGIYKSAKEGRPVKLPLDSDFNSVDMTGFFE